MTCVIRLILMASVLASAWLPASALDLQRRRMLTAAEHVPWRGVGRLDIKGRLGESQCTGTLIAEDLVLTAAHCVVSRLSGLSVPPAEVEFLAGVRLGTRVAKVKAAKIAIHPAYDAGKSSVEDSVAYDVALIRLEKPIPARKAAHFAVAAPPGEDAELTLISYRGDRASGLTRQDGCEITEIRAPVLQLGCEVTFGASGSSFFQEVDGERRVVAVLSAMGARPGKAVAFAVAAQPTIAEVLPLLD